MPGRLGDDPLSRKKSSPAKKNPASSAQPGFPTQQSSHNDVFFRTRTEGLQPKPEDAPREESGLGEATDTDEKPEISEVADIVRTAKAAESTLGAEQLARPVPIDESVHTLAEEPVEKTEQALPTAPEPVPSFEPPPPETPTTSQPEPQPQKSEGFFKKLFGRFGK